MAGGDLVEMTWMARIQTNAAAAGLAGADARGADHDEDRRAGFGTKPIQRLVTRIVSRHVEAGARHAEAYDAGRGAQTAVELLDGGAAVARVDVQPVAEDDVG